MRRGSSTSTSPPNSSSAGGTRVVFPAPGAASTIKLVARRREARISGSSESIGSTVIELDIGEQKANINNMLFGDSPAPGLVGIAKLAAQSDVLESKRVVRYFEMEARSLLNRTRPGMPFQWSLNPYRGCEFGCRYCYARYTHEFMELRESADFEDRIYAKSGIGPILRCELKR